MVMATVRYCEDCTVTIWVPGEGDQGMAGVTIAARDTLRWCVQLILHMERSRDLTRRGGMY